MPNIYTATLKNRDISITPEQLADFKSLLRFDDDLKSRVSDLFYLDLYIYSTEFSVNPAIITEEIINLENGDGQTNTKLATEFRKMPLKGLWHKHFFCQNFLAQNIQIALGKDGIEKIIREVLEESGKSHIELSETSEIARRVINNPLNKRTQNNSLTGEWIIFSKHEGKNYYLCLNTHNSGDENIASRIKNHCISQFPFLVSLMIENV
ncbi:MAG: hypothetical protein CMI00_14580 [Oceanospirillaceae bacterium]|nr:hypothetical protein [Oceanospirillaceae bacterium]